MNETLGPALGAELGDIPRLCTLMRRRKVSVISSLVIPIRGQRGWQGLCLSVCGCSTYRRTHVDENSGRADVVYSKRERPEANY